MLAKCQRTCISNDNYRVGLSAASLTINEDGACNREAGTILRDFVLAKPFFKTECRRKKKKEGCKLTIAAFQGRVDDVSCT
jgi:hypothetical protein